MKINPLYLTLGLLFATLSLKAQVSLEEYRRQVVAYSLDLKKSEISTDSSFEELAKAKTLRLPTLSMSGSFDYSMRRNVGVEQWNFSLMPQLSQTLYGGGGVRAEIDSYGLKCDIALCDYDFTYLEVLYAADYAYWDLLSQRRYRDAMREYTEVIKSLKEVVSKRFEEGYISKGDLLMISTRLSEAEYSLVSAELSYTVSLHNFNILRGTHSDEAVDVVRVDVDHILPPRRVPLAEVLERRPDYLSAQLSRDVYEVAVRSVRAAYNPSLSVGVRALWSPYTPNLNGTTRVDGVAFVQLSATLFRFGERHRAVAVARAACMGSEITELILHDSIELEETNGWASVVDTHAQVRSASEALSIAGENLDISTYSYNEGQVTILDVMQAQISWIQTYTNAINAEFNFLVAVSSYNKISVNIN
ncbi:MAG: TolC family protein [Rikenellaceae bacterium]